VLLSALVTSLGTSEAQPTRGGCYIYLKPAEYYSTVYTRPPSPGSDYVALRGLPFTLSVAVSNEGSGAEVLSRLAANGAGPGVLRILRADIEQNTPAEAAVAWRGPFWRSRPAVSDDKPLTLGPNESIHWEGSVTGFEALPAGQYRVQLLSDLRESGGLPVRFNNDHVVLELRDTTELPERVEMLRIAATQAFAHGQLESASAAIANLLAVYPDSAFGYMIRGEIALKNGDNAAAAIAFQRALDLIRSRADYLYISNEPERSVQETEEHLQAKLLRLGR
jgi:hypothetical protein